MNEKPRRAAGHVVHPRLSPELHARLVAWAERERRSITQSVELLVERALDAEDAQR